MEASIKYITLVSLLVLFGCTSAVSLPPSHTGDFLLIVGWSGAETRPPFEIAFASQGRLESAEKWAKEVPIFRRVMVVSVDEMDRIKQLLLKPEFASHRSAERPGATIQQYLFDAEYDGKSTIFPIGLDDSTISLVTRLQGVLGKEAAKGFQPLIDNLRILAGK